MEVVWSLLAKRQLRGIFDYYSENANKRVATRLSRGIVLKTIQLIEHPFSGKTEDLLANRIYQYRFIVYKHYKIYYLISAEVVLIAAIFDTRQNPNKLNDLL